MNKGPVYGEGFLLLSRHRSIYIFKKRRIKHLLKSIVRFHEKINKHKHG